MPVAMLAGPIKAWWDDEWNTPEHWNYALWRVRVCQELENAYYLVYRPHEAFKGTWDERGQSINDFVLRTCDVVINMTPPGVPSQGTHGEVLYAANFGKTIVDAPAPANPDLYDEALIKLMAELTALGIHNTKPVEQQNVIASLALQEDTHDREKLIASFVQRFYGYAFRFHYMAYDHTLAVFDTEDVDDGPPYEDVLKIEVLDKTAFV